MLLHRRRPTWLASVLLTFPAVGAVALLYTVDPRVPGNYPPCFFLYFTGCYCPGCGTLRAMHRMLHGDATGALGYNVLAVLVSPILFAVGIDGVARSFGSRLLPAINVSPRVAWAALAVIVGFWVLRNVPAYPLTMLAP